MSRPKTIFCDIDGTLCEHPYSGTKHRGYDMESDMIPLSGTIKKLWEWDKAGYMIILTTGRKESMREATKKQLQRVGIFYDQLVMGFGGANRYIINDRKPNSDEDTTFAINITRNKGIKDVEI